MSDWTLRHLLREVAEEHPRLRRRQRARRLRARVREGARALARDAPHATKPVVVTGEESAALSADPTRPRSALEEYEERAEQTVMARAVGADAERGGQLIVEAGTGVGKSLAYLVPTALHAVRNGARTVISTNTINLQEQLMGQDIPVARRHARGGGHR